MDIRKLQRAIVDGLEDVKAQNIVVFNTEHLSPLFERVIIASGTSNRQTKALASSVRVTVKERDMEVLRCEGEENGEWIIVDCGAAVVHVMQPAIRDYYHLEEIWGGKPVNMKMSDAETKLVKASGDEEAPAKKKAAAKKTASKTSAKEEALLGPVTLAKKPAAKKAAAKTEAKPAAKTAAKKVVAKKGVTRTVGVKTPASKTIKVGAPKPAAKKVAAKKVAAKPAVKAAAKPAAKKVASKTVAAKKPAAKKSSSRA
ncbi:ribosome silencing factor [Paucibacter sp. KBW04]|uniref:ribosome silencing factor n=1 Tax=Paucibacter sp. KBW04 TaxID=2153361 RepID=UPI000F587F02|nr:ribosome silencing factor [Paucibacter sp. KBW04]RQO56350.1 ribosome silencing factor [Paucibacter sp. KBW04]